MLMPADRIEEILGLKPTTRGMAGLAAAVEKGLPRSALIRVIALAELLWDDAEAAHPEEARMGTAVKALRKLSLRIGVTKRLDCEYDDKRECHILRGY
jgi:hypothetical protein